MARPARPLVIATLLLVVAVTARAAEPTPEDAHAAYDQWVGKCAAKSLDGSVVAVTLIEETPAGQWPSIYTWTVKPDGEIRWTSSSSSGMKGGNGNKLTPDSLSRLKAIATPLPPDAGRLPPPERRVLIQAVHAVRVYDRAELSDAVAEVLRLSGCGIGAWRPAFKSQSQIDARGSGGGFVALCALCPDGKRLIYGAQVWAIATHETLGDLNIGSRYTDIAFSPDGAIAVACGFECQTVEVRTWKLLRKLSEPPHGRIHPSLRDPHFTPDGRCLVLRAGDDGLRCFDAKTWDRIDPMPEIPADAIQWKPAKSWQHAVMRTGPGVISLWDAKTKSARELDPVAPLLAAAFSPDESQVALATSDKDGYSHPRLRIFQTDTGKLVHELRVAEIGCDRLSFPQWTADGAYVLAVTKPNGFWTSENVSLWNAKTGRHRADFVDCPTTIEGVVLLPAGDQLIAGCQDGQIRFWDFAAALREVTAFEKSVVPSPTSQPTSPEH